MRGSVSTTSDEDREEADRENESTGFSRVSKNRELRRRGRQEQTKGT